MNRIQLPDGAWVDYWTEPPRCCNCRQEGLLQKFLQHVYCSPCFYLATQARYRKRMWGDNEGLMNRRWQFYFNRGELSDEKFSDLPRWETKQKLQTW